MKKILILITLMLITITFTSCDDLENTSREQIIVDNELIKATYLGINEQFGQTVMVVKLENKTNKEITVLPMESSVDDNMVLFTSGTLAIIQPGKVFNQGWIIGNMPEKQIEFKMSVLDENMNELFLTDVIKIEK